MDAKNGIRCPCDCFDMDRYQFAELVRPDAPWPGWMCPVCDRDYTEWQIRRYRLRVWSWAMYRRTEVLPSWVLCMKVVRHFVGPRHWWRRRSEPYTLVDWSKYATSELRAMDRGVWMILATLVFLVAQTWWRFWR